VGTRIQGSPNRSVFLKTGAPARFEARASERASETPKGVFGPKPELRLTAAGAVQPPETEVFHRPPTAFSEAEDKPMGTGSGASGRGSGPRGTKVRAAGTPAVTETDPGSVSRGATNFGWLALGKAISRETIASLPAWKQDDRQDPATIRPECVSAARRGANVVRRRSLGATLT
jgi:hypothetical protein